MRSTSFEENGAYIYGRPARVALRCCAPILIHALPMYVCIMLQVSDYHGLKGLIGYNLGLWLVFLIIEASRLSSAQYMYSYRSSCRSSPHQR